MPWIIVACFVCILNWNSTSLQIRRLSKNLNWYSWIESREARSCNQPVNLQQTIQHEETWANHFRSLAGSQMQGCFRFRYFFGDTKLSHSLCNMFWQRQSPHITQDSKDIALYPAVRTASTDRWKLRRILMPVVWRFWTPQQTTLTASAQGRQLPSSRALKTPVSKIHQSTLQILDCCPGSNPVTIFHNIMMLFDSTHKQVQLTNIWIQQHDPLLWWSGHGRSNVRKLSTLIFLGIAGCLTSVVWMRDEIFHYFTRLPDPQ